ncbi:hypothetical protein E3T40_13245 [Cryobacterium sp. TMT1-19]|uniref:hypothetical protein n=1 Tax=unclassified Cryobacterium TaxID=2649013 RepID=UPI0010691EC6|nr:MULTISPECIES: hypothetical protein [unclassified Cryobacterium]TFD32029.1 hypothetical protein E3T40_13245 [Cryobacterium sp. TMT1-19]
MTTLSSETAARHTLSPTTLKNGWTTVSTRALNRLVCAVAADALGVDPSAVGAELTDDQGNLALTVSAPIRVVALTRVHRDPSIVTRTGGTILERAEHARQHIHYQVGELTGSTLSRVTVRLTDADIRPEDRVQ